MSEKILIFDTSLRDGEQSAGVAFTIRQKLKIAKQLERLGVDIIEAGFPCTSPGDMEAVQSISAELRNTTICALARCIKSDIDAAWEGVKQAADPRIHVFINTSDIQIENQLNKTREQVLAQQNRLRSPMVLRCIDDYRSGTRFPLSCLAETCLEERLRQVGD